MNADDIINQRKKMLINRRQATSQLTNHTQNLSHPVDGNLSTTIIPFNDVECVMDIVYDNIDVIIPFYGDDVNRLSNLKYVVNYIKSVNKNINITIVEQDGISYNFIKSLDVNYISLFVNDVKIHKSTLLNYALNNTTGDICVILDSDMLIHPNIIKNFRLYASRGYLTLPFYDIGYTTQSQKDIIIDNSIDYYYAKNMNPTIATLKAVGGCNICYRADIELVGGWNDAFIGWGGEDTDFAIKYNNKLKGIRHINVLGIHLWHVNHETYNFIQTGDVRNDNYVCVVIYRNQCTKIIRCLNSILYNNRVDVGILIIDDCSTDNSADVIKQYIKLKNIQSKITLIETNKRYGKTCNAFYAHNRFIGDNSICVIVDGDDYLNSDVYDIFDKLDTHYNNNMLCTVGNYTCTNQLDILDSSHIKNIDFTSPWDGSKCPSWLALRTFKNFLFKKIPFTQFRDKRNLNMWLEYGDDVAYMPSIVDFANGNCVFIPETLYIYDTFGDNHWFNNDTNEVAAYIKNSVHKLPYNLFMPIDNNVNTLPTQSVRHTPNTISVTAIAFYLPQYHPIDINDLFWGKGFTEWTNVTTASKLFEHHYQPQIPSELGFYDLRLDTSRNEQAKLASEYGIDAFCYWHYWFGKSKRVLNAPIDAVIKLNEPNFPFCLGWANESWADTWHGCPNKIICEQTFNLDEISSHFYDILHILKDSRYIKYNGKLVFVILYTNNHEYITDMISTWQKLAVAENLPEFHFISYFYSNSLPHCQSNTLSKMTLMKHNRVNCEFPNVWEYKTFVEYSNKCVIGNNTYPVIFSGWDNTPRSSDRGYVLHNYTPELFYEHCTNELKKANHGLIFIKSWNEWAEGNYLEPNLRYGREYLRAFNKAKMQYTNNTAYQININSISFIVNKLADGKYQDYWELVNSGKWEPNTFKILSKFVQSDKTYIDIGGWIGPTTLYGSKLSNKTYVFEPDPTANKILTENISINNIDNVVIIDKAISNENGHIHMGNEVEAGNSTSSILTNKNGWVVESTTFNTFINQHNINYNDISLIKMDVEGAEYMIVESSINDLININAPIYLSLHRPLIDSSKYTEMLDTLTNIYNFIYDENGTELSTERLYETTGFFSIVLSKVKLTSTW